MNTVQNEHFEMFIGEKPLLVFPVVDELGNPVSVVGAAISFKIAREAGRVRIVEKTLGSGITIDTNYPDNSHLLVEFSADELVNAGDEQLYGDFYYDLSVTKSGVKLYVATGTFTVKEVNV